MMTRERALEIIQMVWGQQKIIPPSIIDEVESEQIAGENNLETMARIAELPEVLDIEPFNTASVYYLCNRVKAEREIKKAREAKGIFT